MAYNAPVFFYEPSFYKVLQPCECVVCFAALRHIRNYIILKRFSTYDCPNPFATPIKPGNLIGLSQ